MEAGVLDRAAPIKLARAPLDEAASSGAAPLNELLGPAGLDHLVSKLSDLGLDGCLELYSQGGRTKFLAHCKELGVASLSERQKLAGLIAKTSRGEATETSGHVGVVPLT